MTNTTERIDRVARAFNAAAADLAEAMLAELQAADPVLAAKVAQALEQGERMLVAWEINPAAPAIWWSTIDDYQHLKRIMTLPGAVPVKH
ncbi:hypothetical protein [Stenotrophomonas sp. MMGLT7]|uniref:hypothetical protein n=1 Tax=Stenotrophomonas sp. MMGLT7 TaxID=2901227 RepID=UPI001E2C86B4|nr:hypothetical protein [Stenotrophomonas sp. MMGLT7]MCD7097179.1 hypothetical protein [Stenotrophomonas sp. MMGLT7]